MSEPAYTPLFADPARQAVDAIRGYHAQLVRSVWQWINLDDDEVLFLEGAEDFDKLSAGGFAETTQARERKGKVSLGSREVSQSIIHFWGHQSANPGKLVSFRYLTTAARGTEQASPFGSEGGLDHWERCAESDRDLVKLRTFVAGKIDTLRRTDAGTADDSRAKAVRRHNQTIDELHEFLLDASDEDVRTRLLSRISWDTAAPDYVAIEALISDKLVLALTHHGLLPSEAKRVQSQLMGRASEATLSPEERWLTPVDYLEVLEDAATVRVSRGRLRELEAAFSGGASLPTEPTEARWYKEIPHEYYRQAREMSSQGSLEAADEELVKLLAAVREATSDGGAAHRHFEQGLLLSRAQVAFRRADRAATRELLGEAEALGVLEGDNRYLAGWVLLNLADNFEAVRVLEPSDGSERWSTTLGIAYITTGNLEAFRATAGDESSETNGDVLLALLRHALSEGDLPEVGRFAKRVVALDDGSSVTRYRSIEAAWAVVHELMVRDDEPDPEVDSEEWLDVCRGLVSDLEDSMADAVPLHRILALRRRIEFHQSVMELDHVGKSFHHLAALAPDFAAELAATSGLMGLSDADITTTLGASSDPGDSIILEVLYQHPDPSDAAERLGQALEEDPGDYREDLLRALRIEYLAEAGASVDELTTELENVQDDIARSILTGATRIQAEAFEAAEQTIDQSLDTHPHSHRLLRAAFSQATQIMEVAPKTMTPQRWTRAVQIGERLVARFPCPEFRLALARVKQKRGDLEDALADAYEVEASGIRPARSAALVADIALQLRRISAYADAASRVHEAEQVPSTGLMAATALMRARRYGDAETLYRELLSVENREVLLRAYAGLAASVEAQRGPLPAAREAATRILIEAYDALDAPPELAAALYFRSLGTSYAREVHERISADFDSLAALPGIISIPAEEGLEMIRRDQEGAKLRHDLVMAGALPFELAIELGHRNASYVWEATRMSRAIRMIAPPPLLDRGVSDPVVIDRPLVLDRTALLMLAELGLVETVLEAGLKLRLSQADFDWLEVEETDLRVRIRPPQLEAVETLLDTIEALPELRTIEEMSVDEALMKRLEDSLPWADSLDLALATRDGLTLVSDFIEFEDVPQECRARTVASGDVLLAAVGGGRVDLADAAEAQRLCPSSFETRTEAQVDLGGGLLLAQGTLEAWSDVGLLAPLTEITTVWVSPVAHGQARALRVELAAEVSALKTVEGIREAMLAAVESGSITTVEPAAEASEGGPVEDDSTDPMARIAHLLEQRLGLAQQHGMAIWSDDPAVHCYTDMRGPMASGMPAFQVLAGTLRARYGDIPVYGTADLLHWMVEESILSREEHLSALRELTKNGRLWFCTAEAILEEARQHEDSRDCFFEILPRLPQILSDDVARRCGASAVHCVVGAMAGAWYDGSSDDRSLLVTRLLDLIPPWVRPSTPYGRFCADAAWGRIVREVAIHPAAETEEFLRLILEYTSRRPEEFGWFLRAIWHAVELIDGLVQEAPHPDLTGLLKHAFAQVAVASSDLEMGGRPVLPTELVRLQSRALGLRDTIARELSWEGLVGDEAYKFKITEAEVEHVAAEKFEPIAASWDASAPPPSANVFSFELDVQSECGQVSIPHPETVEFIRFLDLLGPDARALAGASLEEYYGVHAPELASSVRKYLDSLDDADEVAAQAAHAALCRALLESPRLWADYDIGQAFRLLHANHVRTLWTMAGAPVPWTKGEHYSAYIMRAIHASPDRDSKAQFLEMIRGPNSLVLQIWYAQVKQIPEDPGSEYVLDLLQGAAFSVDAHHRAESFGALVYVLSRHPGLGGESIAGVQPANPELIFEPIDLQGTINTFVAKIFASWLRLELGDAAPNGEQNTTASYDLASQHWEWDGLLVATTRYSSRAVLNHDHSTQISAEVAGDPSRDPIGDLLLICEGVSLAMRQAIVGVAARDGVVETRRDLEAIHQQQPFSLPRVPRGEAMVPEALGTEGHGVNPFIILLLGFLWTLLSPEAVGEGAGDPADAAWLNAETERLLERLAERTPPVGVRELARLAAADELEDRFGSLMPMGVEGGAKALLEVIRDTEE